MSTPDPPQQHALKGITEPSDTDVLCGRGGAALRHPGNQTYRRLVNINKGLYITCLKTEKLKISRSIVAAIREQRGRFLEKESNSGTWYDIGDKKAIEKTSQALRENQPKLRQKIVEMGGAAAMESQYGGGLYPEHTMGTGGGSSLNDSSGALLPHHHHSQQQQQYYQQQQHLDIAAAAAQSASMRQSELQQQAMHPPLPNPARAEMHHEMFQRLSQRNLLQQQQQREEMQQHARLRPSLTQRPSAANDLGMAADSQLSLMSQFSEIGISSMGSMGDASSYRQQQQQSMASTTMGSNGSGYSQFSGSNPAFSNNNMVNRNASNNSMVNSSNNNNSSMINRNSSNTSSMISNSTSSMGNNSSNNHQHIMNGHQQHNGSSSNNTEYSQAASLAYGNDPVPTSSSPSRSAQSSSSAAAANSKMAMDRRNVFAKMKFRRDPSVSSQPYHHPSTSSSSASSPTGAGGTSYLPKTSNHKMVDNSMDGMPDFHMVESTLSLYSNLSLTDHNRGSLHNRSDHTRSKKQQFPGVETARVVDHSAWGRDGNLDPSSRHSIMSGLSRISDTSFDHSIFSDLSRKIGNVSTRSIAMSEMSTNDMLERAEEDDTSSNTGFEHDTDLLEPIVSTEFRKATASKMDFDTSV